MKSAENFIVNADDLLGSYKIFKFCDIFEQFITHFYVVILYREIAKRITLLSTVSRYCWTLYIRGITPQPWMAHRH